MVSKQKIRSARGTRTQRQYADDLGVQPMAVSRWERGESEPGLVALAAMANDSGKPMEWFLLSQENGEAA